MLAVLLDAPVGLHNATILCLIMSNVSSLLVRGLPLILLALRLLNAGGRLMVGVATARGGLLTLTIVGGMRVRDSVSIAVHARS